MQKFRVIDVDAHFIEPDDMWAKYVDKEFRDKIASMREWMTILASHFVRRS